jgi:hypothetical protein
MTYSATYLGSAISNWAEYLDCYMDPTIWIAFAQRCTQKQSEMVRDNCRRESSFLGELMLTRDLGSLQSTTLPEITDRI